MTPITDPAEHLLMIRQGGITLRATEERTFIYGNVALCYHPEQQADNDHSSFCPPVRFRRGVAVKLI